MELPPISSNPRTIEEIFKDFSSRRTAIIRALTVEVEDFYALCSPEKDNLCLYGHSNQMWEVNLPADEVPPEMPEPALGINFARDGMDRKDWLSLVALHSDSWLLSVAFYFAFRFGGNDRKRLFSMINELPTVFEVVSDRKPPKDKSGLDSGSKSKQSVKRTSEGQVKSNSKPADDVYGEDDDEHSETLCGTCGGNYTTNEFWIGCDVCERWFHGKCVKITPAKADSIKQYKCPSCSSKRGRQ
ncbi:putative chromatin regulator PHD family [Dioscorea sansibarensis]